MSATYLPLERFLRAVPQDIQDVTLSFEQIDLILGRPLPDSHLNHRQWWENQSDVSGRPQAQAWKNAGFMVEEVNQDKTNGWVRFTRVRN